jgi:vacuolar protein sorting-associated protein 35
VDSPEDVNGVLELCQVLIRDADSPTPMNVASPAVGMGTAPGAGMQRRAPYMFDREEMAEEQGWVARMVHLFRSDSLDVQFEVGVFHALLGNYSNVGLAIASCKKTV